MMESTYATVIFVSVLPSAFAFFEMMNDQIASGPQHSRAIIEMMSAFTPSG
jgi:hypothetical protein